MTNPAEVIETTVAEEWRPVSGYEGAYEVSNLGRVRSLPRTVSAGGGRVRRTEARVLSAYRGNYSKVRLKVDGTGATKNVHALVAEAFIGPRPERMEVCHNNGDPHDNRVENLRYDTHSANQFDTVRLTGTAWTRRTHCNQGHEYTPENTIRWSSAPRTRRCRTCDIARRRK